MLRFRTHLARIMLVTAIAGGAPAAVCAEPQSATEPKPAAPGTVLPDGMIASADPSVSFFAPLVDTPPKITSPEYAVAKQKFIALFTRRPDWSREHFQLHYLERHAPSGQKYTANLLGYTVDLVKSPHQLDAITELWAHDFEALAKSPPDDAAKVISDPISDQQVPMFEVEEKVVRGAPLNAPLFTATPGVKLAWFYTAGEKVPPPPSGGYRVVDQKILRTISPIVSKDSKGLKTVPANLALIRFVWADKLEDIGPPESYADALITNEYRFRASPWK